MTHDKLTHSQPASDEIRVPAVQAPPATGYAVAEAYDGYDEPEPRRTSKKPKFQRYVAAILRRKWIVAASFVVGVAGAVGAYAFLGVEYTAQGNIWVQVEGRQNAADVGPIRQGELFESYAWLELLKTFAVLDPVVVSQRLYLQTPTEFKPAFVGFSLAPSFRPGSYSLEVDSDGRRFVLSTEAGAVLQAGTLGDSIGRDMGFLWQPKPSAFPPDTEVRFEVQNPRDAARELQDQIGTRMDRLGNFISLQLTGPDPEEIAAILNAVMERNVELAAELKRRKLDETLGILEEQLTSAAIALDLAERELEGFRVRTITLPSDAATPIIPGIAETRTPVVNNYFLMRQDLESVRRDRARLQTVLAAIPAQGVRVEALEAIPAVSASSEVKQVVGELVQLRAQLRALRNNFTDDYPPIQDLLRQVETLERETVPRVGSGLLEELQARESRLRSMVDSASAELSEIPSRSIEESQLRRQVAIQENLYNELRGRVETARLASASSIADIQILDRASVPTVPTADDRLRFGVIIFFGSLGAALALAILLDMVDQRIRYADEVDTDLGLEILGSIPRIGGDAKKADENAAQVIEAFRELRMTVSFAYGAAGPLLLTISSPSQSEGKTLISTNLAVAFAEMGRRTLLIDGDTRRGDAHRLLGVDRSPGLTDYLRDRSGADIIRATEYKNLDFIPCGTRGPSTPELLASHRMAAFLATLKRAYDVILVDSPPLAAGADLLVLAGLTGNLAVVLRTGSTDKRLAVAKMETLSRLPIRILGAILNDVEPKGQYYKYYASYLPGYATREEEEESGDTGSRLLSRARGSEGTALAAVDEGSERG